MSSSLKRAAIALGALLLAGRGSASPALHTTFEKYTLPNGLTVILHEDHHSPANLTAGDAECDLLSLVLGGGKSSRLYRGLVQTKLASSVNAGQR